MRLHSETSAWVENRPDFYLAELQVVNPSRFKVNTSSGEWRRDSVTTKLKWDVSYKSLFQNFLKKFKHSFSVTLNFLNFMTQLGSINFCCLDCALGR